MEPPKFVVDTLKVNAETFMLRVYKDSPPAGVLPFNSYVILGKEPILVDTHAPLWRQEYIDAVRKLVDPKDVKWIFLTHDDRDHSGNVMQMLEACPQATLVTQWLAVGRMKDEFLFPMTRVRFCNPGEPWTASGRTFGTCQPPIFDSPSSIALFDPKHEVLFSADSFGALTKKPIDDMSELPDAEFEAAFHLFNGMFGWVHDVDRAIFARRLEPVRAFGAKTVLSGHGPIARNVERLLQMMTGVPDAAPFVGMNQSGLEAMLAKAMGAPKP
jgi:flavorubredoxin